MSERDQISQDTSESHDDWERWVQGMSQKIQFPPTPDIAGGVAEHLHRPQPKVHRRLAFQFAMVLVVGLIGILAIPDLRAIASDVLRIGGIQIINDDPPRSTIPTVVVGSAYLDSLYEIADEVTLEEAQNALGFGILLPTYPENLGSPDHVFLRDVEPIMVILVWMDTDHPERTPLSFHILPNTSDVRKYYDGQPGISIIGRRYGFWLNEAHLFTLPLADGTFFERWVDGNVLIWEENGITYRIESDLSQQTVDQIAESLTAIE